MSALRNVLSWVFTGLKLFGGVASIAIGALYFFQDNLLYHPSPPGFPKTVNENPRGFKSPGEWMTDGTRDRKDSNQPIPFEEKVLDTKDGAKIHVWLMLQTNAENRPTLIYFHGNAGNMGIRLKNAALMYSNSELNVLMMDYRGYGSRYFHQHNHELSLNHEMFNLVYSL